MDNSQVPRGTRLASGERKKKTKKERRKKKRWQRCKSTRQVGAAETDQIAACGPRWPGAHGSRVPSHPIPSCCVRRCCITNAHGGGSLFPWSWPRGPLAWRACAIARERRWRRWQPATAAPGATAARLNQRRGRFAVVADIRAEASTEHGVLCQHKHHYTAKTVVGTGLTDNGQGKRENHPPASRFAKTDIDKLTPRGNNNTRAWRQRLSPRSIHFQALRACAAELSRHPCRQARRVAPLFFHGQSCESAKGRGVDLFVGRRP